MNSTTQKVISQLEILLRDAKEWDDLYFGIQDVLYFLKEGWV